MELVKKNKSLTLQVEKEKTRAARAMAGLAQASAPSTAQATSRTRAEEPPVDESEIMRQNRELKLAHDKMSLKLNEYRQQFVQVKADLQKTQRALLREVGEDIPLAKILDEGTNWRGRAQTIQILKSKLKEAQRNAPLLTLDGTPRFGVEERERSERIGFEEQARNELAVARRERAQEFEHINAELEVKTQELEKLKMKTERAVLRASSLEKQHNELRGKIQIMLEKSANDDLLVDALKAELEKHQRALRQAQQQMTQLQKEPPVPVDDRGTMGYSLGQLEAMYREQEQQLDRQEQIIVALRHAMESRNSETSTTEVEAAHASAKARAAEVEVDKLQELVEVLRDRVASAEQKSEDAAHELLAEKQKCAELERKIGRRPVAAQGKADKGPSPAEKLTQLQDEYKRLKKVSDEQRAAKDEELRICHELLNQNKAIFDKSLQELKKSIRDKAR
eukprot:TRINITY_DN1753_c0_g1_i1.p1 TRINITY_DN1753_c0_g1~~TRINITY_DN1753_c0_g1_i1.p1  ORF type:complete len:513 (+),score=125.54 TRINITY_DN1753_c0_g1_i1:189-1541(+)